MSQIRIFYTRPPAAPSVFEQELIHETDEVLITLGVDLQLPGPKVIGGRTAMEPGSSIVWFTFPGRWHDIGKCYLRDGSFAGTYANVLTPVAIERVGVWHTTDLCLDVWMAPGGPALLLDEDALAAAVAEGAISQELAEKAEAEAQQLLEGARQGTWPPPVVRAWDLERAMAVIRSG